MTNQQLAAAPSPNYALDVWTAKLYGEPYITGEGWHPEPWWPLATYPAIEGKYTNAMTKDGQGLRGAPFRIPVVVMGIVPLIGGEC